MPTTGAMVIVFWMGFFGEFQAKVLTVFKKSFLVIFLKEYYHFLLKHIKIFWLWECTVREVCSEELTSADGNSA